MPLHPHDREPWDDWTPTPEEVAARRRSLGWVRPDGARFQCRCGLATDSPAEARAHFQVTAFRRSHHPIIDGRTGEPMQDAESDAKR